MAAALPVTLANLRAAAARIKGPVVRTPTLRSETLSRLAKAEIWLKFENLQFTASFKERGALNTLLQLSADERKRGVTAEARGRGQVRELVVALGGEGFTVRVLEGRTSNPMLRQHPKHGPARTGDGGRDPTGRLPWPSPSSSVTSSTPSSAPPSRSMPSAA